MESRRIAKTATKPRPQLPAGPYLVVGLARSGAAVAELLARRGAEVLACDSGSPAEAERLGRLGIETYLDDDGTTHLDRVGSVIKSPGVPPSAAVAVAAGRRGIELIGELEVAWRLLPNRFVAITGTNGKTTVTELVGQIFRSAGEPVELAGNVGTPLSGLVDKVDPEATIVCECSSYQLHDSAWFSPDCAVLLNVAPDHLDWHGTFAAYVSAKIRVFSNQSEGDYAIREHGDPELDYVPTPGEASLVEYALGAADPGGRCRVRFDGESILLDGEVLLERSELHLSGDHNVRNAMAAATVAAVSGIDRAAIAAGMRRFRPVAHRLEPVAEIAGVRYVNDSKATNPLAAAVALAAFAGCGVRVLLGGSLKGGEFSELVGPLREHARAAYLFGEAAPQLRSDLGEAELGGVELITCPDLAGALARAAAEATDGEVVLLAPACASFDAFSDYVERGEAFRRLVGGLR